MLRCKSIGVTAFAVLLFALTVPADNANGQAFPARPAGRVLTLAEMQQQLAKARAARKVHAPAQSLHHPLGQPPSEQIPPPAPFLGNMTSITGSGSAILLARERDCSLTLYNFTYQASFLGGFTDTVLQTIPDYQLQLHNNALLNTTPDQFANGCVDPSLGIYSRQAVFGGTNQQGLLTGAVAIGYHNPGNPNTIVGLAFDTTGNLKSYPFYTADASPATMATGDLNGDGNPDFVSANGTSITVFLGNSDGTLQPGVNYDLPSGTTVSTIAIDDVTGDGNLDIIVSEGTQFAVYAGKGDGTLGTPQITISTGSTNYLVTGDFNGDGNKDIATGSGQIFLNNGSGTFAAVPTLAFTPTYSQIAVGDFNRDGKLDLVAENGETGTAQIAIGKGDGTFTAGNSYTLASGAADVYVTDLDGDGNPDVYVGNANGGVFGGVYPGPDMAYALMGNGNGTFQGAPPEPFYFYGPQLIQSPIEATTASTGNIFDLNGDKKLDALVFTQNSSATSLAFAAYLGNGDGTFKTGPSTIVPAPVTTYAIADFNDDGIPDLVYAVNDPSQGEVSKGYLVALGKGDGSFAAGTSVVPNPFPAGTFLDNSVIRGITSADFNHDGKADLMYYDVATGLPGDGQQSVSISEEVVQLGNGDGTFQPPILVPLCGGAPTSFQIAAGITSLPDTTPSLIGDVNGDGFPDLFVFQESGATVQVDGQTQDVEQIAVYLGKGDGTFQAPTIAPASDNPPGYYDPGSAPILADMNGDGKPDLISIGVNTNGQQELGISLGKGDGTFQNPTIYLPSYSSAETGNLTAADFNGDGKLDLTFANGVYLGNGDGTLQVTSNSDGTSSPTEQLALIGYDQNSVAADFNGDGKPDLLNDSTLLLNEYGVAIAGSSSSATTLTVSPNPATVGQSVTFTAQVAAGTGVRGTPTGTVTFYNGTTSLGTGTLASGSATFSTASLSAGTYTITADYGGDSTFAASTSSAVSLTINAAPVAVATSTTLTASSSTAAAGTNLTFTALVAPASGSGTLSGSVVFSDGTAQLGTGTLDGTGKASYSTSSLAVGAHSITASYPGDTNYSASASSPVSVTITAAPADFSISLAQTSGTVSSGNSITSTITIAPVNGFNQAVSLSCSGAPKNATCSVSPSTVTPNGTSPATATLTVQTGVTTAALARSNSSGRSSGSVAMGFLGGGLLGCALVLRRRRPLWTQFLAFLALSVGLIAAATGCGGSSHATPAGTYTITVTASSGTDSHTVNYSLSVK